MSWSVSDKELLEKFPAPAFRPYQKELLLKINECLNTGVRLVVYEAPTGLGKSYINATFCRAARTAFYTTPQITLINQIKKDPLIGNDFAHIMGRRNYICAHDPAATVEEGVCVRFPNFPCVKEVECPYWRAKVIAYNHPRVLTTFHYFIFEGISESAYFLGRRHLAVIDEAHNIDRHLVDAFSLLVSPFTVSFNIWLKWKYRLRRVASKDELKGVIAEMMEDIRFRIEEMKEEAKNEPLSRKEAKTLKQLENFTSLAEQFLNSPEGQEWIWEWTRPREAPEPWLVVMPVYARFLSEIYMWPRAELFIISSATILSHEIFLSEIGADLNFKEDEIAFIRVKRSPFPPENRPIIDFTVGKMTKKERERYIEDAARAVEYIITQLERGRNVAIHCHSYELAEMLYNALSDDVKRSNLVLTHTPSTRQEVLDMWLGKRGATFICVAFEEGQDWKGEKCEAQILLKVPFPDLRDPRVSARLKKCDWNWYYYKALLGVIQAYGRAVRTPEDKARFYVIDKSFETLLSRAYRWMPEWFIEALPEHWRKKVLEMREKARKKGIKIV